MERSKVDCAEGNRVKSFMKSRGLKNADIAETLCISISAVSKIRAGVNALTEDNAQRLSERYGVSADYLLGKSVFETEAEEQNAYIDNILSSVQAQDRLRKEAEDLICSEYQIIRSWSQAKRLQLLPALEKAGFYGDSEDHICLTPEEDQEPQEPERYVIVRKPHALRLIIKETHLRSVIDCCIDSIQVTFRSCLRLSSGLPF